MGGVRMTPRTEVPLAPMTAREFFQHLEGLVDMGLVEVFLDEQGEPGMRLTEAGLRWREQ
jgi:hypothetical protein